MSDVGIPADQFQEAPAPAAAVPQATQQAPIAGAQPSEGIPADQFESYEEHYSTPGQLAKTALEGAAEGIAGPLATGFEKHILGVKPEEMLARREANPVTHGVGQAVGLAGSMLTGVGEGALLAKAGSLATKAAGLGEAASIGGKLAAAGLDQAVQMSLLQGGDEVSKMIINDPNATAQNAISNIGLSAALGGATGVALGAISPLWKATFGSKASQLATEITDELHYVKNNPNPIEAATQELTDLHGNTQALKESLYSNGIKGDLLKEHLPELNTENATKITNQADKIISLLDDKAAQAAESVDTRSAAPYLEQRSKDFKAKFMSAETPEDAYNAINDVKKTLMEDAKRGRAYGVDMNTSSLGNLSAELGSKIRPMLEDTEVWGKAGDIQKTFNQGFSEFTGSKAEKDFLKTFTREVGGERVLDEAKLNTFVNQMDKPQGKLKNQILENYIEEHGKFADKINSLMTSMGKDPLVPPPSLNALSKLRGEPTQGAKLVQTMIGKELDKVAGKSVATAIGAGVGSMVGAPGWGALIGEHVLGSTAEKAMAGLAKSFLETNPSGNGLKSALNYTIQSIKGQTMLSKAVSGVFEGAGKIGAIKAISQADRDKLDQTVTKLGDAPGRVTQIDTGHLGHYMPQHQSAMTQSSVSAGQYLHDLKPRPYRSSPLDAEIKPGPTEIARYNRALDIAQQPSIVLQHVKDGTLQPSDIKDLHTMYPALYQQMANKISDELTQAQNKGVQIPYKTKIGVSLFLGQPMDSSMTPSSIQAAQPMPTQQPQQGPVKGGGKSMKSLGKTNESYQTPNQAAEADKARTKH